MPIYLHKVLKIILIVIILLLVKIVAILQDDRSIFGEETVFSNRDIYIVGNGDRWLLNLYRHYGSLNYRSIMNSSDYQSPHIRNTPVLYQIPPLTGAIIGLLLKKAPETRNMRLIDGAKSFFSPIGSMSVNLDIMQRGKSILDNNNHNNKYIIEAFFAIVWVMQIMSLYIFLNNLLPMIVLNANRQWPLIATIFYAMNDAFLQQHHLIDPTSLTMVLLFFGWYLALIFIKNRKKQKKTLDNKFYNQKYVLFKLILGLIGGVLYISAGIMVLFIFSLSIFISVALQDFATGYNKSDRFIISISKLWSLVGVTIFFGIIWAAHGFSLVAANDPFLPYKYIMMSFVELWSYLVGDGVDRSQLLVNIYVPLSELWFEFLRYSYGHNSDIIRFAGIEWANGLTVQVSVSQFFRGSILWIFSGGTIGFIALWKKIGIYEKILLTLSLLVPIFAIILRFDFIGDLHYGDSVDYILRLLIAEQFVLIAFILLEIFGNCRKIILNQVDTKQKTVVTGVRV